MLIEQDTKRKAAKCKVMRTPSASQAFEVKEMVPRVPMSTAPTTAGDSPETSAIEDEKTATRNASGGFRLQPVSMKNYSRETVPIVIEQNKINFSQQGQ